MPSQLTHNVIFLKVTISSRVCSTGDPVEENGGVPPNQEEGDPGPGVAVHSLSSLPFAFDTSFSAVGCQPKRKSKSLREEGYPFAAKPVLGHDDELLRGDVETKFTVQGWGQAAARHQLVGEQKKPSLPHLAPHLAEQLSPSAVPGCSSQFPGSAPSGTSPKAIWCCLFSKLSREMIEGRLRNRRRKIRAPESSLLLPSSAFLRAPCFSVFDLTGLVDLAMQKSQKVWF